VGGGRFLLAGRRRAEHNEEKMTDFTETEQEILVSAWALHARDKAFVPVPDVLPDCDRLSEAGWLEPRTVDATGAAAFRWTKQAETALDINNLTDSVKERQN
jgi:hypothetical protein